MDGRNKFELFCVKVMLFTMIWEALCTPFFVENYFEPFGVLGVTRHKKNSLHFGMIQHVEQASGLYFSINTWAMVSS